MMLDQMFTAENFRRIYDSENRRGVDLATRYFPETEPLTRAVRDKIQDIRDFRKLRSSIKHDEFNAKLVTLKEELIASKKAKSGAIDARLESISQKVLKPSYRIALSLKSGPKGKPVYCIDATPETFFVVKQLQRNIHHLFGVKQANRHALVCQLRDTLSGAFPFEVVRTDITSFYESIDRRRLFDSLDRDQLLSPSSRKYIKQILDSYSAISGSMLGIPRGVGISAYLAELYLKQVDEEIREIPGLVLYCRFVDDIVAVFARPPIGEDLGPFKDRVIDAIGKRGLANNPAKTLAFNLADVGAKKFEYLGYRFHLKKGQLKISPSAAKILKYRSRMDAAFKEYRRENPVNPRGAFRKLVSRMRFLTGNTRLSNSKSQSATGIYFSNSIATELSSLELLDKRLKKRIDGLKRTSLQRRLRRLKFTSGFEQRRYHTFNTMELKMIVSAWKNGQ